MERIKVKVFKQDKINDELYSICFDAPIIAKEAKAGQFISVYSNDKSRMLPRPFGICEIDKENGRIRVVYRIVGEGTKEFSSFEAGDEVYIMGPLGNGFTIRNKKAILIGGGTGIPIMLELAKTLKESGAAEGVLALGFRDETFMTEEFEKIMPLYISTESGCTGTKGNVLDAIRENNIDAEVIYACGPIPMLKAIKEYANEKGIEAQISLEEKMACGIGACLACVCKSKEKDTHSNVNNKRICKEGPVFGCNEIEL